MNEKEYLELVQQTNTDSNLTIEITEEGIKIHSKFAIKTTSVLLFLKIYISDVIFIIKLLMISHLL